ncbi:hypothetical protein PF006_g33495 [Phytophthora fragariae]|nr:hypothetical protein PF009_g33402 [Phytophthora fragariae]KAE8952753.1 hypothetical protein PF011_g32614 [Phytophthora fragariae]KAE9053642.1 hypothetical protein PF006_g33495 [Phytophthora fragariae]
MSPVLRFLRQRLKSGMSEIRSMMVVMMVSTLATTVSCPLMLNGGDCVRELESGPSTGTEFRPDDSMKMCNGHLISAFEWGSGISHGVVGIACVPQEDATGANRFSAVIRTLKSQTVQSVRRLFLLANCRISSLESRCSP